MLNVPLYSLGKNFTAANHRNTQVDSDEVALIWDLGSCITMMFHLVLNINAVNLGAA